jgi:hypothetical protein
MSYGTVPSLFAASALGFLSVGSLSAATADDFITVRGSDPPFAEVMRSGKVPRGKNTTTGFQGSNIRVNHDLLKNSPDARRKIPDAIKIHTLGNSAVNRRDFPNWTRWYQEDKNTQVFRLFNGEENVRNSRELAARIEAFSEVSWGKGEYHEWVGTFTIIKPHGCSIFQVMNSEIEWALHLTMNDNGDVIYKHRRGGSSKVIARNMVGKPFHIRVRDNGHDFEVFLNGKSQGKGTYARPAGKTNFRWGMYLGANPVRHEAILLVTGAGVDVRDHDPDKASALETETREEEKMPVAASKEEDPVDEEKGLRIPERDWTNGKGVTVRAPGLFEPGTEHVTLRINGEWVIYPLDNLSEKDRKELLLALDFIE